MENEPFNPIVYTQLMEFATKQPIQRSRQMLTEVSKQSVNQMASAIDDMILDAYMQGVRDGFTQAIMRQENESD